MRRVLSTALLAPFVLAACASGPLPTRDADPSFFIGTNVDDVSANGLEFADGTQSLADAEGHVLKVRLARFVHDPSTDERSLVVSEEFALLPDTFTSLGNRDMVLTLDGATLIFFEGEAELPSGQRFRSYLNDTGDFSGTAGIYSYASTNPHMAGTATETEGYFAFGFETDPTLLAALSGEVTYRGFWYGYGQLTDLDGAELDGEVRTDGSVTMLVDLGEAELSGLLSGTLYADFGEIGLDLVFFDADILGNGFVAAPDLYCDRGTACSSGGSIGGLFYGLGGEEISGVIGFDETVDAPGDAGDFRFIGAAGFTAASGSD